VLGKYPLSLLRRNQSSQNFGRLNAVSNVGFTSPPKLASVCLPGILYSSLHLQVCTLIVSKCTIKCKKRKTSKNYQYIKSEEEHEADYLPQVLGILCSWSHLPLQSPPHQLFKTARTKSSQVIVSQWKLKTPKHSIKTLESVFLFVLNPTLTRTVLFHLGSVFEPLCVRRQIRPIANCSSHSHLRDGIQRHSQHHMVPPRGRHSGCGSAHRHNLSNHGLHFPLPLPPPAILFPIPTNSAIPTELTPAPQIHVLSGPAPARDANHRPYIRRLPARPCRAKVRASSHPALAPDSSLAHKRVYAACSPTTATI
jgi:hypothetical protein